MYWITQWIIGILTIRLCLCESEEARLYANVMTSYTEEMRHVRPVTDVNKNLTVNIGMTLIDVVDFDPRTGTVEMLFFERLVWKDAHLTWIPKNYKGVSTIRVPHEKIWKPDITLYNSLDVSADRMDNSLAVIQHDGTVLWVPRARYPIRCNVTEGNIYECSLKFGSWTYSGNLLNVDLFGGANSADVNDFKAFHEWEILKNTATQEVSFYDCCPEPYPNVNFYLKLRYIGSANGTNKLLYSKGLALLFIVITLIFR